MGGFRAEQIGALICQGATPGTQIVNSVGGLDGTYPILVPAGSVGTYKAANGWSRYADRIVDSLVLLTPQENDFGAANTGYAPLSQVFTIENATGAALTNVQVALSGDTQAFTVGAPSSADIAAGKKVTFTVSTAEGLGAGSYTAAVQVTAAELTEPITATVRFTVQDEQPYTVTPDMATYQGEDLVFTVSHPTYSMGVSQISVSDGTTLQKDQQFKALTYSVPGDPTKYITVTIFKAWLDAQEGGTTKTLTFQMMNGPEYTWPSVTIMFPERYDVTLAASPAEGGTVYVDGAPDGAVSVAIGANLQLEAVANAGYELAGWRWQAEGSSPGADYESTQEYFTFTPESSGTLTAVFRPTTAGTVVVGGVALDSSGGPAYATTDADGSVALQTGFTDDDEWQVRLQGNTLTLRGAKVAGAAGVLPDANAGIWWQGALTLVLEGENDVTTSGAGYALYGEGSTLTIQGTGSLTADVGGTGAASSGVRLVDADLVVQDAAALTVRTGESGGNGLQVDGTVTVQGMGVLTASAGSAGQALVAGSVKLAPTAPKLICAVMGESAQAAQPLAGSPFSGTATLDPADYTGRYFRAWGADLATVALTADSGSITYGDTVTYTVQVAGAGADAPVPTGRVQFYLGSVAAGNELGAPLTLQDGKATLTVGHSKLTYTGTPHKVMAVYLGSDAYANAQAETTTEVAPLQLAWQAGELTASKAYDGTTAAPAVYGTVEVSGVLDGDEVTFTYTGLEAAAFTSGDAGTTETLAVTVQGAALGGAQAGNYLQPTGTLSVEATIHTTTEVPAEPADPSAPGTLQYQVRIEEGVSRVPAELASAYASPAELAAAMRGALAGSGIAAGNTAVYDIALYVSGDGTTWRPAAEGEFPAGGLKVVLPYPAGTSQTKHDFALVQPTLQQAGPGGVVFETLATTEAAGGLQVTLQQLQPVGLGWKAVASTPSGSGQEDDGEYEFWEDVKERILAADKGDMVKVDARRYDRMPWDVMQALRLSKGVTLKIEWKGGDLTITSDTAPAREALRGYWPFELLEEMGFDGTGSQGGTGSGTGGQGSGTGTGGGTTTQPDDTSSTSEPDDTSSVPQPEEPTEPDEGDEGPAEPAGPGEEQQPEEGGSVVLAAVLAGLALLVVIVAALLLWRRRKGAAQ